MNKVKELKICANILILIALISIILNFVLALSLNSALNNERCEMYYNQSEFKSQAVDGIYFHNGKYYTVWTDFRLFSEIERTDRHEYCHYLVHENYDHFCAVGNVNFTEQSHDNLWSYFKYYYFTRKN